MRLRKGIKCLYLIRNRIFFLFFILLTLLYKTSSAQQITFRFSGTSAAGALMEIAAKLQIKIAFDAVELKNVPINKQVEGSGGDEILTKLLNGTGFRFEKKYDTYLIVKSELLSTKILPVRKMFTGIVFDKESGERLPYANISVPDEERIMSSAVDGTFSFSMSDSAFMKIKISYLGYNPFEQIVRSDTLRGICRFGLIRNIRTIGTVHITGDRIEMVDITKEAGHFTFNPIRFSDLPNFGETDVFRSLQLLPGIGSSENSSQMNIRGSSADQNLVIFDGYTLYNLDHFFGVFSALNPYVIKNIQVYRGGFDSRYGERVSGIVDITGKSGNQFKPMIYGGINLISGNLTVEMPISKKLTLIAAGRRAYSDLYSSFLADAILNSKIGQITLPPGEFATEIKPEFYFSDYNLKATYNPNSRENLSFSIYGAKDYLDYLNYTEQNQVGIDAKTISKWGNYGFGGTWQKRWNAKYFTEIYLGHSGYFNDYYNKTYLQNRRQNNQQDRFSQDSILIINETNDLIDYFITFKNSYELNSRNQFEYGASVKFNQFTFYKDADQPTVYNDIGNSSMLYSVFYQDKMNLTRKLEIKPGLRLNLYGNTGNLYAEPRFQANYDLGGGFGLKMATGRYYQFLSKLTSEQNYGYNRNFWVLADGDTHPVVSSNHFIIGGSFTDKHFLIDLECYYKTISGLQEYLSFDPGQRPSGNFPPAGPSGNTLSRFITGSGKAYGLDLLLKYENGGFTSWFAYSLSQSIRNFKEINNNNDIPAPFDQRHDLKWTNLYSTGKWNFSTLTLFNTGHPYIEKTTKDRYFNSTRTYSRLPNYFRIDLSANYNFYLKKVFIKPGVSLINALNTSNYFDIYTRSFNFQDNNIQEKNYIRGQEISLNFFINFRF
jgi:ferric enterobactin receptor